MSSKMQAVPITDKIDHIVVVMLENRSFDNLLGWLYADENNRPPRNLPFRHVPTYDGLEESKYWNTIPANDHEKPGARRIYATRGTTGRQPYKVPNPNPHEVYPYFIEQMFGTEDPGLDQRPSMTGFLANYVRLGGKKSAQIMETYSPNQVPVLSTLAREFAVCDRWFSSLPCETLPNRAFLHAGSSFGRLNNMDEKYNEGDFPKFIPNLEAYLGKRTIFDELRERKIPWGVYQDSVLGMSLLSLQFWTAWQKIIMGPVSYFSEFESQAAAGTLPVYSFLEPEYVFGANDEHPGPLCDVRRGEAFLYRIWKAVSTSPAWTRTLLIIT